MTWDMIETEKARSRKSVEQDMSGTDKRKTWCQTLTLYTYDKMDNVLSKNTEHGNYGYQYDNSYRLTNAANPLSTETYTYDAVGNRLTSANVTGSWSYNGNNELTAYDGVSYQ